MGWTGRIELGEAKASPASEIRRRIHLLQADGVRLAGDPFGLTTHPSLVLIPRQWLRILAALSCVRFCSTSTALSPIQVSPISPY